MTTVLGGIVVVSGKILSRTVTSIIIKKKRLEGKYLYKFGATIKLKNEILP